MEVQDSTRARIVDALLVLVASRGVDHLTVRNIAAEAGMSVGAVQHHFGTKDSLVIAAMQAVDEKFRRRLRERLTNVPTADERLRIFCREIACIEGPDLTDAVVWTAFAARACTDAPIRALHAASWAGTEQFTLTLLADAYPDVEVTADDAALLLAVTDGIAVARGAEQSSRMSPRRAMRLIEHVLRSIAARGATQRDHP